jgi:3-mercaptopyruvate sulfurtransferase SseA
MRNKFALSLSILIAAVVLISCNGIESPITNSNTTQKPANTNVGPETTYADGVRRITTDELEALMKSGEAFVVDVRNQDSYDLGHIPGSKVIPAAEIGNHLKDLPRDKMIVTYCS